jgi:hypothetical protein
LAIRNATLNKCSRAALSTQEVEEFCDRFERTAANIYNYDKMNLKDNQVALKAIFQRGVKYAEQQGMLYQYFNIFLFTEK